MTRVTLQLDLPSMSSYHLIGDRKPQTRPAVAAGACTIYSIKTIKNLLLILSRYADSSVFDNYLPFICNRSYRHRDLPSGRRILQRVLSDVAKRLMQPISVGVHQTVGFYVLPERDVSCFGNRGEQRVHR